MRTVVADRRRRGSRRCDLTAPILRFGDAVIIGSGEVTGQALEHGLVDELRLHLAPMVPGGGTRASKEGRARRTGNAMFARRGTPCTSPTEAGRSRQGATTLHSSAGGKEMYFLSRPQLPIHARPLHTEGAHRTSAMRADARALSAHMVVMLEAQIAGSALRSTAG